MTYPSAYVLSAVNTLLVFFAWSGAIDAAGVLVALWWGGLIIAAMTLVKLQYRRHDGGRMGDGNDPFDWSVGAYVPVVLISSGLAIWLLAALALRYDGTTESIGSIFSLPIVESLDWFSRTAFTWPVMGYVVARAGGHIFSFFSNYLHRREFLRTRELLEHAVGRIIAPQLLAVTVAIAVVTYDWPAWIVAAAGGLTDVIMHLLERIAQNPDPRPRQPFAP